MIRLLITDFKRIFKDKLFIVLIIIGTAFAFVSPVLYKSMFLFLDETEEEIINAMGLLSAYTSGKGLYFASFNIADNFGFLLPILITIVIYKDYSYGTIRNKIVSGHSRTSIYLSQFISTAVTLWLVILYHAIIQFTLGTILFGYGADITFTEVCYFFLSTFFMFLAYLFVASIISFLTSILKHSGTCVILYIALVFILTIVGAIASLAVTVLSISTTPNQELIDLLNVLTKLNLFTNITSIGSGLTYSFKDIALFLISSIGGTLMMGGFGFLIFKRKQIK